MNRNEPSGTHVLNAGGGGDGIGSDARTFSLDAGSGVSGDIVSDPRMSLGVGRLTSASTQRKCDSPFVIYLNVRRLGGKRLGSR